MKRINKLVHRSVSLETIIYALISICGFLSQPLNTPAIIIDKDSIFENDIIMTIGKIGLFFTIFVAYVVNYICCKLCLINLLCEDPDEFTSMKNVLVTFITVMSTTLLGCLYSGVTDYLALLGGFVTVVLTYLIPTYIYLKTSEHKWYSPKIVFPVIITGVIFLIGWIGGIVTLKNMIGIVEDYN